MISTLAAPKASVTYNWRDLDTLVAPLQRYLGARCRSTHDAQDVLQETLIRAARYRRPELAEERLRSWTLSIAANVLRDLGRKRQRDPSVGHEEAVFLALPGREPEPGEGDERPPMSVGERLVEMEQLLRHLTRSMGELSAADQDVLRCYYGPGGSSQLAARVLGLPLSLVKVRLFRARQRLRRRLELSVTLPIGEEFGTAPLSLAKLP